MRRIILALSLVALTACTGQTDGRTSGASGDAGPADTTGVPAAGPSANGAAGHTTPDADAVTGDDGNGDASADMPGRRTIVVVGTSLTAGYGVGAGFAYPAVLQQMIDSAGLPYRVVNAGISGETSAGGLRRIDWSLQQPTDVLVLELGANDALRGLDVDQLRSNLDAILTRARELHPGVTLVLLGMEAPPNLGESYTRRFRDVYSDLAARHDAVLLPFLLDGVAGDPSLNIDDGIHPNVAGQRILAQNVWRVLRGVLVGVEVGAVGPGFTLHLRPIGACISDGRCPVGGRPTPSGP